ncbi:hypothetical protein AAEX63_10010 [Luteococcus sp. H138]|uniref:hypothetical protein n=1 Tax=unclassified Luteococcus TaxID=2639923 RepID=UPI00313D1F3F
MPDKKKAATFASVAVAGLIVAGGATAALNANAETTTPTNGSSYGAPAGQDGERGGRGHGRLPGTEVTGDELTKVTDAVKAKDSAFTVEHVLKDSDGTYHVMGTKSGNRAGYEVSKDLKTITAHTMGERGGKGGGPSGQGAQAGHQHTAATADETAKVTAAVKAKDSAVTVEGVQKDPDGSYDVRGTKAGSRVMVEVSKDLKTVDVRTGGPGQR